jgi:hypothetical protein
MMAASHTPIDARPTPAAGLAARLTRALAVSVLVASILPVVLLGPSLLRAPVKLGRELHADVQRLLDHGRPESHRQAGQIIRRVGSGGRR